MHFTRAARKRLATARPEKERFLVFIIPEMYQPKNGQKRYPHFMPDAEMLAKMGRFWK